MLAQCMLSSCVCPSVCHRSEVLQKWRNLGSHKQCHTISQGQEIAFENGRISNFQGLVTLTLDRVILHTVVHHSSTSTYMPNFIEIEKNFYGRANVWIHGRTFETGFIRSTLSKSPPKKLQQNVITNMFKTIIRPHLVR